MPCTSTSSITTSLENMSANSRILRKSRPWRQTERSDEIGAVPTQHTLTSMNAYTPPHPDRDKPQILLLPKRATIKAPTRGSLCLFTHQYQGREGKGKGEWKQRVVCLWSKSGSKAQYSVTGQRSGETPQLHERIRIWTENVGKTRIIHQCVPYERCHKSVK